MMLSMQKLLDFVVLRVGMKDLQEELGEGSLTERRVDTFICGSNLQGSSRCNGTHLQLKRTIYWMECF